MRNPICAMFGHKRNSGWYGDGLYGDLSPITHDNIGRLHASLSAECDRCGQRYILARFHPNSVAIVEALVLNGDVRLPALTTEVK